MTQPLLSFRVYPEGSFLYAQVNIWPTKKAMYEHKALGRVHEASCTGIAILDVPSRNSGKRTRKRGVFAELNFCRKRLGSEVTSHEFTHAMFCFAERRNFDLGQTREHLWGKPKAVLDTEGVEERCCYALGRMYRQFVQKCLDAGIY